MKIQLKHSNVLDTGAAKQPTAPNMLDGEIAVNFNATDPAIFIKNSDGNIVRIAGKDNLSFTGYETSIQAAATPPSGLVAGNLYFDTDDNRLYYYYDNGTTQQWVDASTEKFDVTIIPDPTNLNHQSGTLDDRYVNSNGDTMTGNLVLNAGVNLNSSDVYLNNGKVVFEGANANAHEIRLTVVEPTADRVISLPDVTGTLVSTGDSGTVTSGMIADGTIQNSDVSNSAAIGLSKLATGALPSGITVASTNIVNGTIVDADINSSAAIALTKLGTGALPSGITITSSGISGGVSPTDIAAGALPNNVTVVSANIVDGSIVNADISNTASIQVSKLADGNSYQLLQTNAAGNGVEWTSNIDVPGTLDVTGISTFDDNLTVAGNLAVTGSTVSLDANIVTVKDGNIQLGVVSAPTDVTADGGGITLKGSTDKTLSWINSTDAWTSSEHFNLATGKAYYVNGSEVLNGSSLGSSVTGSSLTGLGTISSGVWQGTQIVDTYLATITGTGKVANSATSATNLNSGNAIVSRDGSGDFTARNVTAALIGNASTASALENARTIALTGDLTGSASFDGSSNISISTTATFTGTTNLTYNSTTRKVESDTGTDATIPLFSNTVAGLAGASGGGTVNYLRADGSWASPPGTATNLGYTAATSTITSSTGTGVAIPNFSSTNAGFVQGSGGGTTKFLRADGNWIALGSSSTSISTSPPSNPNAGDSWFDTDEGRTYIYYQDTDSSQWVEANPSWNGGIPTGSVTPGYLSTGGPNWDASGNLSATGSITAASGVISGSLTQGGNNVVTVGDTGTVTSTMILDGTIVNTDINSAAAIALNKLASGALPSAITIGSSNIVNGTIVDADISTSAAISLSKLSSGALPSNITVTSSNISDLSIVNTDVNASAAIAGTKISPDFGSQNVVTTGSLGVGTSSPSDNGSDTMLAVKRNASGQSASIAIHAASNAASLIRFADGTSTAAERNAGSLRVDHNSGSMQFSLQDNEKLRIDSSGRLLVGTTNAVAFGSRQVLAVANGTTGGVISLYNSTTATANPRISSNPTGSEINNIGIHAASTNGSIIAYTNNDTERLRIDSSGRLLVGSTTEGAPAADNLTLQDSGSCGLTIRAGTSNYSSIYLSNATSGAGEYAGSLQYGHSDNSLRIGTNSIERMRIDSSGRVGIGTTSPGQLLHLNSSASTAIQISDGTNNQFISSIKTAGNFANGSTVGDILIRGQSGFAVSSNNGSSVALRIDSSGTAIFAGNTQVGGASYGNVNGLLIEPAGGIRATNDTTSYHLFRGYTRGNPSNTSSITADGSATFAGSVKSTNGSGSAFLGATSGTGVAINNSSNATVIELNYDGSARHAGTVWGGSVDGGITATTSFASRLYNNSAFPTLYAKNSGNGGLWQGVNSSGTQTSFINSAGTAEFGPINVSSSTGYGSSINIAANAGDIRSQCQETASSFTQLYGAYRGSNLVWSVLANGDSTITGNVIVGASSTVNPTLRILGNSAHNSFLQFADGDSTNVGQLQYSHSSNALITHVNGAERMRITSGGFVNIGAYTVPSSTPGMQLYGAGNLIFCKRSDTGEAISFYANSTTKVGNIVLGASSTTYNTSSDYRLKENVAPLAGATERLKQLPVHRFNFIVEPDKTVDGFLAHEAADVVPECVTGEKDAVDDDGNPIYQGIDQSKLVPLLTAALQEAIAKIETLEQRLSDAGIA